MGPYEKFSKRTSEWYIARIPDQDTREELLSLIEDDSCGYRAESLVQAVMNVIILANHKKRWQEICRSYENKLLKEPIINGKDTETMA